MPRLSNTSVHTEAAGIFPGGVNSPVRAFRRVGGVPRTFIRGKGPWLVDVEGRRYLDFVCAWGSLIHGHACPPVVRAATRRTVGGSSFGAPTVEENRLGALIRDLVPGLERLRFVSSGTEATMSALRLARAATGRSVVLKFDGCYHGHSDGLLVAAGSGVAEGTSPDSAGVPEAVAALTLSIPYNDTAALAALFQNRGSDLAAVIVEPVAANMGLVLPEPGFLVLLRELCNAHGVILIFDEVITGFRLAPGGAQDYFGVRADLVCLGKIIGGGFPAAAFGGRRDLMELLAPLGPVYQAGTLSGNPVAMAAGLATLKELLRPGSFASLCQRREAFTEELAAWARERGWSVAGIGAMFGLSCSPRSPRNWAEVSATDQDAYCRLFHQALARGLYLPPSPFETAFLSTRHGPREIRRAMEVFFTLDC